MSIHTTEEHKNKDFSKALLPVSVYASFRTDQNVLLYTWVSLLPCVVKSIKIPTIVRLICGIDASSIMNNMISHELLILYRCTLWYLPHLLLNQSYTCSFNFDWEMYMKEIMQDLKERERKLFEESENNNNKLISTIKFLHLFENTILQCIMLSKIILSKDIDEYENLKKLLPNIMNLNNNTLQKLDLEQFRTQQVNSECSIEEQHEINQWKSLQVQYRSQELTMQNKNENL
jgi:hypothetical protein